jgi:hypothetical protein
MANTWRFIASANGGSTIVDFNSIPQTFTDLVVLFSARATNTGGGGDIAARLNIRFSGQSTGYSSAAFYSEGTFSTVYNAGTSGASEFGANIGYNGVSSLANTFSNSMLYLANYTATIAKPVLLQTNSIAATSINLGQWGGAWTTTPDAITSIRFFNTTNSFSSTSRFYLYGINNTV